MVVRITREVLRVLQEARGALEGLPGADVLEIGAGQSANAALTKLAASTALMVELERVCCNTELIQTRNSVPHPADQKTRNGEARGQQNEDLELYEHKALLFDSAEPPNIDVHC